MNKNKFVKSLMILVLVLFSTVLLTACGKDSTKFPTGNIDDSVYVSAGNHQVTKKELYNEFRFDSLTILQTLIDEKLFADYFNKVDYTNEDHKKVLVDAINQAIFGTKEVDDIKKANESEDVKSKRIKSYVDSLVIVGKIDPSEKDALITSLMANDEYVDYPENLLDIYKQKMAVRIFAKEKLDEELEDEDSKQFIKDKDIVDYYKANRQGRYDVKAFWTEFLNLNEQRAVFRELSIKYTTNTGELFRIPDIRILDTTDENYIDINDSKYQHVKSILDREDIKYEDDEGNRVEISKADFQTYYDSYTFSKEVSETGHGFPDTVFTVDEVLEAFVAAHNLVHGEQLKVEEGVIKRVLDDSDFPVYFEYDDIKNSQLRNFIYTSLKLPKEDDEDNKTDIQYSQRPNTFGDYVYLAFKFSDDSASEEGILNEDKDDFLEGNDDLIAELKAEMIEKKLSDTYVSEKVNEYLKDKKLNIYDPILRALYSRSNEYKGSEKMKDNDTLAEIDDIKITVDEFYEAAEKAFGVSIASDLLTSKILKEKYYDKITKEEHESNETQMKNMILSFGQNQFAANGYPASIGRNQFLLLAFRANSVDEAIEKAFVLPKLTDLFNKDIENHFATDTGTIYEKFAELSAKHYDNFWALRSSHILIYLDHDLDGTPDNPSHLPAEVLAEAHTLLPELIKDLFDRIGKETTEQKGIDRLISDFNDSTRLSSEDEYDKEHIWAKYKRFGFKLKNETLGEITNSSNFLSSQSRLDEVFYARAKDIYEIVKDYKVSQLPYLDFFLGDISFDPDLHTENIETAFGWHLIMATGVDNKMASAKLNTQGQDYLSKIEDKDGNPLDGFNEEDKVNATQIEIYLKEAASEYAIQIKAKAAIEKQFGAVKAKYESQQMKSEITYRLLDTNGLNFTNEASTNKFNELREINKLQLFDYQIGTSDAFDALWGDWFTVFQ